MRWQNEIKLLAIIKLWIILCAQLAIESLDWAELSTLQQRENERIKEKNNKKTFRKHFIFFVFFYSFVSNSTFNMIERHLNVMRLYTIEVMKNVIKFLISTWLMSASFSLRISIQMGFRDFVLRFLCPCIAVCCALWRLWALCVADDDDDYDSADDGDVCLTLAPVLLSSFLCQTHDVSVASLISTCTFTLFFFSAFIIHHFFYYLSFSFSFPSFLFLSSFLLSCCVILCHTFSVFYGMCVLHNHIQKHVRKYWDYINQKKKLLQRYANTGNAATRYFTNAGKCVAVVLLCVLHIWHRRCSTVGRYSTTTVRASIAGSCGCSQVSPSISISIQFIHCLRPVWNLYDILSNNKHNKKKIKNNNNKNKKNCTNYNSIYDSFTFSSYILILFIYTYIYIC